MDTAGSLARCFSGLAILFLLTCAAVAQPPGMPEPSVQQPPPGPPASASDRSLVRTQTGSTTLADDQGQVWREYDIRPYVTRVRGLDQPERTIVQWILRETGTDLWFREPTGLLTAEKEKIRVYQTPEVQTVVAEVVERFVRPDLNSHGVSVRLITLESANWRSLALPFLRPVTVQTAGVEAWLISREHAAMLRAHLRGRVDYREHNSANVRIQHGQSHAIEQFVPRTYAQGVNLTPNRYPGFQIQQGQIQEGFSLQISPLATADGQQMEVVVQCSVDQIEQISPLQIDLRSVGVATGAAKIEVPQVASWRLHERFRWPIDEVLIISRGMVAMPGLKQSNWASLPTLPGSQAPRADAVLILGCHTESSPGMAGAAEGARVGRLNYHGRY